LRLSLSRYLKYQYYRMIRLKDTPSKVAQGVGLGFALDFAIPIPYISIFFAFVLARVLKINSLAAVMSASFLKLFFPAIVYINFTIQKVLVSAFPFLKTVVIPHPAGTNYFERLVNSILAGGVPYLLAGLVNGAVIFIASYLTVFYLLRMRIERVKNKRTKK